MPLRPPRSHAAVEMDGAFSVLVIAEGLDRQRQQGGSFFGEHGRDLPLGGAMDARVGPVRFPILQVGLRLLRAFEAQALQRGLLARFLGCRTLLAGTFNRNISRVSEYH